VRRERGASGWSSKKGGGQDLFRYGKRSGWIQGKKLEGKARRKDITPERKERNERITRVLYRTTGGG